ncbi:MAG: Crp/Fnr family transcriptional regulator [Kiritimatiellae bacterium]|nr:Crp/Fnr family transcriptional regulator [Kiritimatiellia bacterium]
MYRNFTTLPVMCKLFEGIPSGRINDLFSQLAVREVSLKKGEVLFGSGSKITDFAVIISGQLAISSYDADGHRKIVELLEPMEAVAISLAVADIESVAISVEARQNSDVILFNANKVLNPATKPSEEHIRLLRNITKELARKAVRLGRKMRILSSRATSERLMKYLIEESVRRDAKEFDIPYDRQSLADYLCVERSALSAEISKLIDKGIIESHKNHFKLM